MYPGISYLTDTGSWMIIREPVSFFDRIRKENKFWIKKANSGLYRNFLPIIMTITIDLRYKWITYFTEEMTWKQFMTQKRIRSFRMHL